MPSANLFPEVAAVRRFNRFYTRQIGVLQEGLLESAFSLSEVRLLYELAHRSRPTASELGRDLDLDPGYLSRLLRALGSRGLIRRRPSETDGRRSLLELTDAGRSAFSDLDARSNAQVGKVLQGLAPSDRARLLGAMASIERLLGGNESQGRPRAYLLRPPYPGDLGWVVQRHGQLYAQEYGWDERFEALVAGIVAEFVQGFDPKRERCWIVEGDGENLGCVFVVRSSEYVAKLRLLLVEPAARGSGIGGRLVGECVRFARQARYRKLTLWTNSVLHAARHIYQEAGFTLVREEPQHGFGQDLVGQTWELVL
ncbi:MAG: MarR family transcriptional regulator [Gemmatimonadales bacterium]|nr:MarR family transcriptional regulator [Gemmatimonadales bacterium]